MKTYQQWHDSNLDFSQFALPGDVVDDDTVEYFLGVVPPAFHTAYLIQCGEPHTHNISGEPLYTTFDKVDELWFYRGHCLRGNITPEKEALHIRYTI